MDTHTVSVNDRIEAVDNAQALKGSLEVAIAAAQKEVDYYDRLQYSTGGYLLTTKDGLVQKRGYAGQPILYFPLDGVRSANNFITQKQAEAAQRRWALDNPANPLVITTRNSAVRDNLMRLQLQLTQATRVIRDGDPYFDASPSAQYADANGGDW